MSNFLISIAADINREHELAEASATKAVEHALRVGQLLAEVKAKLNHGEWLAWVSANLSFTERSAQRYMRVALKLPELPEGKRHTVSDLSLRQAMVELADPRDIEQRSRELRAEGSDERRVQRMEMLASANAANPEMNAGLGQFGLVYADPPWTYENMGSESRRVDRHYPVMETVEICALPVHELTGRDGVLFMWTIVPLQREAFQVMEAWGFEYRTQLVWDKERAGMGHYFRVQHEILMVGIKGSVPTPRPGDRLPSVLRSIRRGHSQKPDEVYEIIERMYPPLPKIELFARSARPGWATWGNQVPGDDS